MLKAGIFVVDGLAPSDKTQRGAMKTCVQLKQLNQILRQGTRELAAATRQLKQVIVRRRIAEDAIQKGGPRQSQLLEHSRPCQFRLRPWSFGRIHFHNSRR